MGGYGSGGHNRRRDYLEGRRRIPMRWVRQNRIDRAGVHASISWTDNWERSTGSIQIVGGEAFITLVYSVRGNDDESWAHVEEKVALARVNKPFGGAQLYFLCPRCGRRVLQLAMGKERFRCRVCLGLVHASSQERPVDRAMRRANKLKKRLGAEPGLDSWYSRPKHMRRTTFDRIDAAIQAAEAEVNDEHIRILGRLQKHAAGPGRRISSGIGGGVSRGAFW